MAGKAKAAPVLDAHEVLVKLLGEMAGVAVLAIMADSNDTLGKIAVALMLGWLLIFIITNPVLLQKVVGKV